MTDHTPTPYFPDNLEEYAAWVAKYGLLAPYGICQCGCGQPTDLTDGHTATTEKYSRGDYLRFRSMHSLQGRWYNSLEEYFWTFCEPGDPNECWPWQGSTHSSGYGAINFRGKTLIASRVSWEIHNQQPFPKGKIACHECDNRPCVNPHHIWPGTRRDNNADMVAKRRHAFGERNHNAKLTGEQVEEIRELSEQGLTPTEISRIYPISDSTVSNIVSRKTWKHVKESNESDRYAY